MTRIRKDNIHKSFSAISNPEFLLKEQYKWSGKSRSCFNWGEDNASIDALKQMTREVGWWEKNNNY